MGKMIVGKKWGHEEILAITNDYIMKTLHIEAGKSISLQYHLRKDETWYIAKGKGVAISNHSTIDMKEGDFLHIPNGMIHQITALEDLVVVEASSLHIDDIVRIKEDVPCTLSQKPE
jgi:mannose-6-phosphate isomerase-like protein (cupin superfamily)